MVRVADYIAEGIARLGVRHVFLVTGGGAMHLDDAIGQRDDLIAVFDHHEQACAIAAEGYARTTGGIGAVCVTTGPGGTNTMTGVLGQWHDSIPALYVSGQVRLDTTVASTTLPLRQLGDQEADIVRLVAPITKYAVSIVEPLTVRYHFEKATWLATHGRPGPVWLDIPLNVQAAQVEPGSLTGFDPRELDPGHAGEAAVAPAREASTSRPTTDGRRGNPELRSWPPVQPAAQAPGAFSGEFARELAATVARYLVTINLAVLVFNLLPGFPLDGGRLVRAVLWAVLGDWRRATRMASALGIGLGYGLMALGAWLLFRGAWSAGLWNLLLGLFLRGAARASFRHAGDW